MTHHRLAARRPFLAFVIITLGAGAAIFGGCARAPQAPVRPEAPLLFPAAPLPARVQYLGAISSPQDLPRRRTGFAELVLGPEPLRYPLVKPIAAILVDTRLYVCDTVLNNVVVYDMVTGEARELKGNRGGGRLQEANNITTDEQGRFYVSDKKRQAVMIYGPDEVFIKALGRPGEALPVATAVRGEKLYVCDVKDHQIEIWNRDTGALLGTIGSQGAAPGQFHIPTQIALDGEGNIYVTDTFNFRVQKLSPDGRFLMQFGQHGDALGHFAFPKGMDVDRHGRVYVADARFDNVQIFNPTGQLLLFFGGPGRERGGLDLPAGLRVFPWPANVPWLTQRLAPGFAPESLVIAVSQKGDGLLNLYAVAATPGENP
ncbi:MAG: hypothetical protein M1457_05675 [bacterium]|nr:hypothetical protein [bacterium]